MENLDEIIKRGSVTLSKTDVDNWKKISAYNERAKNCRQKMKIIKEIIVHTAATTLMLVLDIRFAILLVANIVLVSMKKYIESPLKKELDYPLFNNINIYYEELE